MGRSSRMSCTASESPFNTAGSLMVGIRTRSLQEQIQDTILPVITEKSAQK
ncbi:hypothetical protein [Roseofilum sp. Guam]|uniref:hypothetical protein n=1 Tax=Roseofilum sp. Guam TaxID=2821502 RepID=UPI001B218DFF|nr:hypothetical protein [Roseofilum sp. Guam]MBP0030628.1 hypothetical protein [Roseofilum sp. Guam]